MVRSVLFGFDMFGSGPASVSKRGLAASFFLPFGTAFGETGMVIFTRNLTGPCREVPLRRCVTVLVSSVFPVQA